MNRKLRNSDPSLSTLHDLSTRAWNGTSGILRCVEGLGFSGESDLNFRGPFWCEGPLDWIFQKCER